MTLRISILIACLAYMAITAPKVLAQSEPMFSQYMLNGLVINPAYAGVHKVTDIALVYRNQWTGISGSPETQTLSLHTLLKDGKSGLGFNLIRDNIGVTSQTIANGSYAYKVPLRKGILSLGLMARLNFINFDFPDLHLQTSNDPVFTGKENTREVSFGAGMFYHTERFFLGLSMPHLTRSDLFSRHWFLHAGYVLEVQPFVKLKPSVLIKYVDGAPLEIDLNATVFWKDKFWLGASLRSFDGVYALTGLNITRQLGIGYAFDLALTDLNAYAKGTHEIMLKYRFSFNKSMILSPRYF